MSPLLSTFLGCAAAILGQQPHPSPQGPQLPTPSPSALAPLAPSPQTPVMVAAAPAPQLFLAMPAAAPGPAPQPAYVVAYQPQPQPRPLMATVLIAAAPAGPGPARRAVDSLGRCADRIDAALLRVRSIRSAQTMIVPIQAQPQAPMMVVGPTGLLEPATVAAKALPAPTKQ